LKIKNPGLHVKHWSTEVALHFMQLTSVQGTHLIKILTVPTGQMSVQVVPCKKNLG
jgi:hypothetical protein